MGKMNDLIVAVRRHFNATGKGVSKSDLPGVCGMSRSVCYGSMAQALRRGDIYVNDDGIVLPHGCVASTAQQSDDADDVLLLLTEYLATAQTGASPTAEKLEQMPGIGAADVPSVLGAMVRDGLVGRSMYGPRVHYLTPAGWRRVAELLGEGSQRDAAAAVAEVAAEALPPELPSACSIDDWTYVEDADGAVYVFFVHNGYTEVCLRNDRDECWEPASTRSLTLPFSVIGTPEKRHPLDPVEVTRARDEAIARLREQADALGFCLSPKEA